jgi:transcriptional regulator with XRE-family HTH domain
MAKGLNPLAALIEGHREQTKETYRAIAARAQMAPATVHALANNPIKEPPKLATLEKLATGLQLDLSVVQRAAQEAAGFHVYDERTPDSDVQILIGNYAQLTPAERAQVAALVESFLKDHARDL